MLYVTGAAVLCLEIAATIWLKAHTGGGDSPRASEARSQPTRGRYRYVRDRVQYALGKKWQRQEKTKKRSKELDNCGHIEGLFAKQQPTMAR
jgi:hypothetical protein